VTRCVPAPLRERCHRWRTHLDRRPHPSPPSSWGRTTVLDARPPPAMSRMWFTSGRSGTHITLTPNVVLPLDGAQIGAPLRSSDMASAMYRSTARAHEATNRCMKCARDSASVRGPAPRQSGSRSRGSEADGSRALSAAVARPRHGCRSMTRSTVAGGALRAAPGGEPAPRPTTVPVQ
jgi:hypothetical protein